MNQDSLRNKLYEQIMLIRMTEERILELFSQGKLHGTTHTYIGQESVAVGVINHLKADDIIFSSHRCHGHYLARFGDPTGLLAELMGRKGGVCGGLGGSQHLCRDQFFSSGIQGGYVPIAAGMVFARRRLVPSCIGVVFIGDGTLGEGTLYEGLNLTALRKVPLLVIVENNQYAQSTPIRLGVAGKILDRALAFGLSAGEIESNDPELLHCHFHGIIRSVRESGVPRVEIVHTYRLSPHSKGDDFRPTDEIAQWRSKDPVVILGKRLEPAMRGDIEKAAKLRVQQAEMEADAMPLSDHRLLE